MQGRNLRQANIERISQGVFYVLVSVLLAGSLGLCLAMHRNLFGPGGQLGEIYQHVWDFWMPRLGYPDLPYGPNGTWARGLVLRPALIIYGLGYVALLAWIRTSSWAQRLPLRTLLDVTVLVGIPLLLMPFLMSSDLFDYSSYGRLAVLHKSNPYLASISEFPTDHFNDVTCWKAATSVYGPAWTILSIGLVCLSELFGGAVATYVLAFRGAMFACQLASGALIWTILTKAGAKDRVFKTAIWLFNPLVMVEFAGNGHNEGMMIMFLLAGIALDQRGRWGLAAVCMAVAVQTKLYCLPAFCLYLGYRCWKADDGREALKRFIALSGILVAVSIVLYAPFGLKPTTILAPIYGPGGDSMTKSLGDYFAYRTAFKFDELPIVGILFRGNRPDDIRHIALNFTAIACFGAAFYARSLSRAATAMGFFFIIWCTIGATWFMPWYVTTSVAFVPLSRSKAVSWAAWTHSITVFLIYLLEGWSFSKDPGPHNWAVSWFQPLVFIPPLVVLVSIYATQRFLANRRSDTLPALTTRHERIRA